MPKRPALPTALIHHPYTPPAGFAAPQPGVFKASTVIFPNTAALLARDWRQRSGYTYGLHGTPTTFTLEERIATLEGGRHTLLVPSGLAAITLTDTSLLASGDEVLIPDNAYGPGKELARTELARWGIAHRFYDAMDPDALAAAIGPATKLVWLEAAGSVTMEFPDLPALVRVARDRGVLTALDNTWGAGVAFDPFAFDVRSLGQPVQQSEVIAVVQAVPGVVALDLDWLYGGTLPAAQTTASLQKRLLASRARVVGGAVLGAELLTLAPTPLIALGVMT